MKQDQVLGWFSLQKHASLLQSLSQPAGWYSSSDIPLSSPLPHHTVQQLFERPINNRGARALIPSENGRLVPFTPAATLKSYPS